MTEQLQFEGMETPEPEQEKYPYLYRQGTASDGTARTYIRGANGLTIMGSTQGYNDLRDRARSEEIALEALFWDPSLRTFRDHLIVAAIALSLATSDLPRPPHRPSLADTATGSNDG